MSTTESKTRNSDIPGSLNEKGRTIFDYAEPADDDDLVSPFSKSSKKITPYLGLRSRLSQVWLNKWTILILLVLMHFLFTISSLNDSLDSAKVKALEACTKVEDVGSAFASMPHYLSVGVNQLTASGITHAVHALMTVLDMILTGIEQLILFVIGMMTDTYMCLTGMVIHGGLNASAVAVEKTTDAINKVIDEIADGIASKADDIQKVIDDVYSVADKAGSLIDEAKDGASDVLGSIGKGLGIKRDAAGVLLLERSILPPKPDLQSAIIKKMDQLKDVQINTTGFVQGLDNLNDKIPTFDELKNLTASAVSMPFDLIRKEINEKYGDWKFDDSVFPIAEKEALSFCSDNKGIDNFFTSLYETVYDAKITAIIILAALAIAVCIPMYILERRRWRKQNLAVANAVDFLDYGFIYSSPLAAQVGIKLSNKIANSKNARRQVLIRWIIAYSTSLPALFVLSLAFAGFFACFWQGILLKVIQDKVPQLSAEVGDFAEDVVKSLTQVSERWSDDANGVLLKYSHEINDDVLGKVTNGTAAVNATLNTFMNEIDKGINTVFGDTIFKELADGVVHCLLGLKVEAVQKGLTWVHDHAHVDFPMFPQDLFSVGANRSIHDDPELTTFLASPRSVTTDEITGAVEHVTTWLRNQIIQEALVSAGLLLIYALVVLMGVTRAMYVMMTPGRHDFVEKPAQPSASSPPSCEGKSPFCDSNEKSQDNRSTGSKSPDNYGYQGTRRNNETKQEKDLGLKKPMTQSSKQTQTFAEPESKGKEPQSINGSGSTESAPQRHDTTQTKSTGKEMKNTTNSGPENPAESQAIKETEPAVQPDDTVRDLNMERDRNDPELAGVPKCLYAPQPNAHCPCPTSYIPPHLRNKKSAKPSAQCSKGTQTIAKPDSTAGGSDEEQQTTTDPETAESTTWPSDEPKHADGSGPAESAAQDSKETQDSGLTEDTPEEMVDLDRGRCDELLGFDEDIGLRYTSSPDRPTIPPCLQRDFEPPNRDCLSEADLSLLRVSAAPKFRRNNGGDAQEPETAEPAESVSQQSNEADTDTAAAPQHNPKPTVFGRVVTSVTSFLPPWR